MEILNILGTVLWILMTIRCTNLFILLLRLKDEDQQFLVFTLNILMLAGLNISIGLYSIFNPSKPHSDCSSIQELYFGTSLFQLLLAYCVADRIKRVGIHQKQQ